MARSIFPRSLLRHEAMMMSPMAGMMQMNPMASMMQMNPIAPGQGKQEAR